MRTVTIGRLTVEVVYPAEPGSTAGLPEATYDVRDWLPPSERSKVPDAASPAVGPIGGHLYRDVPIDAGHGPYPVAIFVHGTASFRIASGSTLVQWASRGIVVLGADYPGLFLADQLCQTTGSASLNACNCAETGAQDIPGDVNTQLAALASPSGGLAFLAGRLDTGRIALSGHSQGGCVAASLSGLPNVQAVLPFSASTTVYPSASLQSILYASGMVDTVMGYDAAQLGNFVCPNASDGTPAFSVKKGYTDSPGPTAVTKRLVGIAGGGHLVPTDLCQNNAFGRNAIQEAEQDGVCGIDTAVIIGLPALFDCGTIDMPTGVRAVNYASTAALEETLLCRDRSAAFASLQTNVPVVGEFLHAP